jgi:hypothetical protein
MRQSSVVAIMAATLGAAITPATAPAAIITYPSRASFAAVVAAMPTRYTETYDGVASGTSIANNGSFNGITYSVSSPFNETFRVMNTALPLSGANTLGVFLNDYGYATGFGPSDTVTLTFSQPMIAFGANFSTSAQTSGSNRITTSASEAALSHYEPFGSSAYGQFVGITSTTPFNSVRLTGVANAGYNLDNITIAVPEPAGAMCLLLSLFAARVRCLRQ